MDITMAQHNRSTKVTFCTEPEYKNSQKQTTSKNSLKLATTKRLKNRQDNLNIWYLKVKYSTQVY